MNFFKSFSVYTVAGFLSKSIAFLLLPFFTHYLSRSDYGIINIFSNSIYFIAPFMGLGIGETFSVEFPRLSKEDIRKFITTSLFLPVFIFILCSFLLIPFGSFFQSKTGLSHHLLFLVILLSVFNFFTDYIFIILRNLNKPVFYASVSFAKTVIELLLAIWFIKYCHQGANGRINSIFFSSLLCFVFVVCFLLRNKYIGLRISKVWIGVILKRGIPTIPLFFMIFVLGNADNYMVNYYYGSSALGIYGLAWQFAMIVSLFTTAFTTPFYPFLYQRLEKGEYGKILKVVVFYLSGLAVFMLLLITIMPFVFKLVIAPKFHEAIKFIPFMLGGQFFWTLFLILCGYIFYKRKNAVFYFFSPVVIILTLLSNYYFLVVSPVTNYAVISLIGYMICFLLIAFILRKDLKKLIQVMQKKRPLFFPRKA